MKKTQVLPWAKMTVSEMILTEITTAFPHDNNYGKEGVSFSRWPAANSALLNNRDGGRERVKAPVGGSALSFPSSPHCRLLLWQWKHHWMTSSQNTLHTGTVERREEAIAQWWHHIAPQHYKIYLVVLNDHYIPVPWYLHYTPMVRLTTCWYQRVKKDKCKPL